LRDSLNLRMKGHSRANILFPKKTLASTLCRTEKKNRGRDGGRGGQSTSRGPSEERKKG